MNSTPPTALVLLNMGGPDSLEAVEPFLYNLFSDRDLIQLPAGALLQRPFAWLISHFRAKKVRENYRAIGGRSPLLDWTRRQAQGIARELGPDFRPYVAMRYWPPTADEVVRQMAAEGIGRAVVLSMYPHYTPATTGSSLKDFRRAAARLAPQLSITCIEQWYDWPGYLDACAGRIREGLRSMPEDAGQAQVLFSAHALPQKFIDRGDPYLEHVQETVRGVMQRVGEEIPFHLGFQSRSGPVQWMEPDTLEVLDRLAAQGVESVLLVPVSFVSDHIETLHEIDVEMREHAEARGVRYFRRSPSLNDHPEFLRGMADLVRHHLAG